MNFHDLVYRVRREGLEAHEAPRSTTWAAELCDVSKSYFYCLYNGERIATKHMVARIALGLGLLPYVVQRALDRSWEEAEVTT
jgi:hypothetical protein